jgi:xanthine dehydrogenase accessory factor
VKGAGDVGSAVTHALFERGYSVLLVESATPSTARRAMSFAEAIFGGYAELEGVTARRVDDKRALRRLLSAGQEIPIWVGSAEEVEATLEPDVVVDARMRKREQPEQQLHEAPLTIGLGPGFEAGVTTHLAIETSWGPRLGEVLEHGSTEAYTGQPREVLGYARERYAYAPAAGTWTTSCEIGDAVKAGDCLGAVAGQEVRSQISGVLRGITRDGVPVAAGAKVGDVDPRGAEAQLGGITERPRRIAAGVRGALEARLPLRP